MKIVLANEIENLIFDAYKSNNCQDFSAVDTLYQLLQIIKECQHHLISGRNKSENMRESEYVDTINRLEKIKNIHGTQKYQLRAACKNLADLKRFRLKTMMICLQLQVEKIPTGVETKNTIV